MTDPYSTPARMSEVTQKTDEMIRRLQDAAAELRRDVAQSESVLRASHELLRDLGRRPRTTGPA